MIRRETIEESREASIELSDDQAGALQHAGRKLASSKLWWGDAEEREDEPSAIICRRDSPGRWKVTVANAVGLIGIDGVQIAVRPKIPTAHLLYLLGRSGLFPRRTVGFPKSAGTEVEPGYPA